MRGRLLNFAALFTATISLLASFSCSCNQPAGPSAINQNCTLTIINGGVSILASGSANWVPGSTGMTLAVGTRINTLPDSKAMITFYDGSTVELDQTTDLEIQNSESKGQSRKIVLKQILGNSVNRVIELLDPGSRYEIQTPSAYALVRGTLFSVEVDGLKDTIVKVIEKTVIVGAQGQTVSVPAGYQVTVLYGSPPAPPVQISSVTPPSPPAGSFGSMASSMSGGRGPEAMPLQQPAPPAEAATKPVRVEPLQQPTPPVVLATDPLPGAVSTATRRAITATFNTPMDCATINTASFTLVWGTTPVAGIVTYNFLTATFLPDDALKSNSDYHAIITTAARSLEGLPLANDYVWFFRTLGSPVP